MLAALPCKSSVCLAHLGIGSAVVAGWLVMFLFGLAAWVLRREPMRLFWRLLAALQALLGLQLIAGLTLLGMGRRAVLLHYLYGVLSLAAVLSPWLYAPREPRRRLAWFAGATLVAAALAVRAYMTS